MRKIAFFVMMLAVVSGNVGARGLEDIKASGVIKIAADGATPPFNYYGKGKALDGFEVDIGNEVAKRLGVKAEWGVQPFSTLLTAVRGDKFDLIASSHAVTPARAAVADFSDPLYCVGVIIVSKEGGPRTTEDLAGKVVVTTVGTVYYERLKAVPGIKEIRTVPNEMDGLQNLLSGKADAWVTEEFVAQEAVKGRKNAKIQYGDVILSQKNAMVVAKGNKQLQKAVNRELKNIVADGTYSALLKKYFDKDISCK